MMKILFLFILTLNLFSSELNIEDKNIDFSSFNIDLYEDTSNTLKIEDIIKINNFQKISNNIAKGYSKNPFWYKIVLKNSTNGLKQINILITEVHNDQVDFYTVVDNKVQNSLFSGLQRVDKDGQVAHSQPLYSFTLESNEIKNIYIRVWSNASHTYSIKVFSNEVLNEYNLTKERLLSLYVGAILALLLYNLFLYITLREIGYLFYILFGSVFLLSHIHLMGYYPTKTYPSLEFAYNMSALFPLWFAIFVFFTREILKTKYYLPKIDSIIKYIGYLFFALTILALIKLYLAIFIMNILMLIILPIFIVLAIVVLKKGYKVAIFYILAEILFVVSNTIFGLLFAGVIEYSIFTRYSYFVGSLVEIILFSLALGYATYSLKQENQKQKELVNEYSKLSFLGQTVINIYHQWKAPVNNIYNSINHIEAAKEFKDEKLDYIIDENLENIKLNTQYLKDTSTNYLAYYKGIDQNKTKFYLKDEIETIVKLHQKEFDDLNINISVVSDEIELFMQKNILTNVVIILVENAISVCKLREIKNPKVNISATKNSDGVIIKVIDNLGGIKEKNINDIFEKNHSVSTSTGLGLYLVREFLLPKIGGVIDIENTDDGVCFKVYF